MGVLATDVTRAVRLLLKAPGFSLVAIAALALGIATSTAIFSVLNTVLLTPFAYPDPERIVMFQNTYRQFGTTGSASPTEFNWWRQQTRAFQDVSAHEFSTANLIGHSSIEPNSSERGHFFNVVGRSHRADFVAQRLA